MVELVYLYCRCLKMIIVISFLITFCAVIGEKKNGGETLGDMFSGLDLGGIISGVQEMLGKDETDGKKGNGEFDQLKDLLTGLDPETLKQMLGQLDMDQISRALGNMLSPEDVWAMMPEHIKNMLPESWFKMGKKLGIVLAREWDKVAEVLNGLDKLGSLEEFWGELGKKAPILTELLEKDVWKGTTKRWTKFEGKLNEEAKQYVEQVKTSGWEWLTRQVFVPALRLKPETKQNMKESLAETFPTLKPMLEKAENNEKLVHWAGQWHMMAELEQMFGKMQSMTDGIMKDGGEEGSADARGINADKDEGEKTKMGKETNKSAEGSAKGEL